MKRGPKKRGKAGYTIGAVAEMYNLHPQTLRLYEREGLLIPSRSSGNTRFYSPKDLARLEMILKLTRDLGVNLPGVSIVLDLRERMEMMRREMEAFVEFARREFDERSEGQARDAIVRVPPPALIRTRRSQ